MVINNVKLMGSDRPLNIKIRGSRISRVSGSAMPDDIEINFDNALAFPGLINSHDHLDFNLFPQLGNKKYINYTEWGGYIHQQFKDEIAAVRKVPVELREQWGIIKNLLCGVTMVVNHGEKIKTINPLISVHEDYQCIHSVRFEKRWKLKLNNPLKWKFPVVIHIGEGTGQPAHEEVDQLIRWNILRKTLIGVHGVAMSVTQAKKFKALVWCPASNYFLLNKTAPINKLKDYTTVLFGTDSTLTGSWDIWGHIRLARKTKLLDDKELYDSFSVNPAKIWGTQNGKIKQQKKADIVVAKTKYGQTQAGAFFETRPEDILLVVHKGAVMLFDEELYQQLNKLDMGSYSKIYLNDTCKYIKGDVPGLIKAIKKYYPGAIFPVSTDPTNAYIDKNILETAS